MDTKLFLDSILKVPYLRYAANRRMGSKRISRGCGNRKARNPFPERKGLLIAERDEPIGVNSADPTLDQ